MNLPTVCFGECQRKIFLEIYKKYMNWDYRVFDKKFWI